jgi:hypothetical protein
MRSGPTELLSRDQRLERAGLAVFTQSSRDAMQFRTVSSRQVGEPSDRCLFCLCPLPNGSPVCSDECDDGYWNLVPTVDGELWRAPKASPPLPAPKIGRPNKWAA